MDLEAGARKIRWFRVAEAAAIGVEGVAALEFALLAPLMIYTLLVAADIGNAFSMIRRLTNAADVIAQLASQQTVLTESGRFPTGTIEDAYLTTDFNSIITTIPDVLSDAAIKRVPWQSDIQATVSSVTFGPSATCVISGTLPPVPPVCTTAVVTWSAGFANAGFADDIRACGALSPTASNSSNPSLTTLPPGLYAPGSVIVVDLTYVFNPLFSSWLTGPFTFRRTAYFAPRFFTQLAYDPGPAASPPLTNCRFAGTLP